MQRYTRFHKERMAMDDDLPQRGGTDILRQLTMQDLTPLSLAELDRRAATLEAELERTRAKRIAAASFRAAADSLFGKR